MPRCCRLLHSELPYQASQHVGGTSTCLVVGLTEEVYDFTRSFELLREENGQHSLSLSWPALNTQQSSLPTKQRLVFGIVSDPLTRASYSLSFRADDGGSVIFRTDGEESALTLCDLLFI